MANSKTKTRCAIYTRKSTDEGLEQEFNSLDAQYEACAAYIASQKHEGWKLANKRYDDGGISGGTMERDGLKVLLADIDAGLIDMIVIYKIDRLTRSLSDFSKIVDRLDAHGASFVSVTQSFNTATSMGRLTLNMLLSFAQFEREVTAERIRDKIAASKAKGLWMGGTVPLGYDPNPDKNIRGLVMNEREAKDVKRIFVLYDKLGNLSCTREACERESIRSKYRPQYQSRLKGGSIMTNGQIHHILTNPIYIGKIRHKDKLYDGQHKAIIDEALWKRVQSKLQAASARKRGQGNDRDQYTAPLKGKLFDETGDHLTPSHTKKGGRTIRYYISNRLIKTKDPTAWRLPAKAIENALEKVIRKHLNDEQARLALLANCDIAVLKELHAGLDIDKISSGDILNTVQKIDLEKHQLIIQLDQNHLSETLAIDADNIDPNILKLTAPMTLKKRGVETKIVIGEYKPIPNSNLLDTLCKAHFWLEEMKAGRSPAEIVRKQNIEIDYFRKRVGLALLSPKLQQAITMGEHPDDWSVAKFVKQQSPRIGLPKKNCFHAKIGLPVIP